MFCREQAVRIKSFEKELNNAGIQLAGIGNGTAAMAREFSEKFQISYPLYTDPQRQTYKALGMKTRLGFSFKTPLYVGRALRCLLYTSPSPRDATLSRMPSSA